MNVLLSLYEFTFLMSCALVNFFLWKFLNDGQCGLLFSLLLWVRSVVDFNCFLTGNMVRDDGGWCFDAEIFGFALNHFDVVALMTGSFLWEILHDC